ncbi:MAG: hypothetical protein ACUVV6_01195 [Thermoplasmatota archaeon]
MLDAELERISAEEAGAAVDDLSPEERARIAREVLEIFFNIWIRFAVDLGRELRMSPWQWDFVIYDGGKHYRLREGFNFSRVAEATLEELSFPFVHKLRAELRRVRGKTYLQVAFHLEEEREYGRAGATGVSHAYIIYLEQARRFSVRELKRSLEGPLRAWIRSEALLDPAFLWDYCHRELRRG